MKLLIILFILLFTSCTKEKTRRYRYRSSHEEPEFIGYDFKNPDMIIMAFTQFPGDPSFKRDFYELLSKKSEKEKIKIWSQVSNHWRKD